jgi:hypothetical protein
MHKNFFDRVLAYLSKDEKVALLDDALLFMYAEEVALTSIANTFMDVAMKIVFASGAVLGVMGLVPGGDSLGAVTQLYGYLWNYIDTLGGVTDIAAAGPAQPGSSTARKVWDKVDTGLNASTTAFLCAGTVLAHVGIAAAVLLPGISFAACMWASLHSECKKLQDSTRKLDPNYLLADRIAKRNQAMDGLQKVSREIWACYPDEKFANDFSIERLALHQRIIESGMTSLDQAAQKKIAKLEKKRQKLMKQYCRFDQQAEILKSNVTVQPVDIGSDKKEDLENKWLGRVIVVPEEIKQNKKLYDALLEKQKSRVTAGKLAVAAKSFAAVGMTFIALAPLAGPAAPLIGAIGIGLSMIAGILKIAELIYNHRADNRKHIAAEIKTALLVKYKDTLERNNIFPPTIIAPLQRLKYRLAYEALTERTAYQALSLQLNIHGSNDTEKKFYEHLLAQKGAFFGLGKSGAQKIVDQALENKIDDTILRDYYFERGQAKDTLKPIQDHLTSDDKKQLVKVACSRAAFFQARKEDEHLLLNNNDVSGMVFGYPT